MSNGELILYTSEDGAASIQLRAEGGTVWLSLAQMADLFQTSPQAVTQLISGDLRRPGACRGGNL